ncbi:MAG: acetylxylan esterase [Verrucomicrobiales bacterium]|nr:acetylxylan esterase [Verrucomicrobiales bacterium]
MNPLQVARGWALAALAATAATFPPPADLPARPEPPDPLACLEGQVVQTAGEWERLRRPELKALFQHYMYGHLPPPPKAWQAEVRREDAAALGGQAALREVILSWGATGAPRLNLLVLLPNERPGPVPVILGINFCGNHAVLPDPQISLPTGWMPRHCPDCPDNRATEAGRGKDAPSWDVAQVIARGFALAVFYHGDLEPDYPEAPEGIRAFAARGGLREVWGAPQPDALCPACPELYAAGNYDWSTLAAWAWGFHRAVDYLLTDRRFDPKRLAVFGHSRNGKTALLAGAFDERIALVLCHQAGCGGSAPSRGRVGESVKQINDRFPHWFNAAFKQFNDAPERLPFDQHALIALCAPRPVLLSNATEDQWANPAGQFDMLVAASPVYRLLGVPGLAAEAMPAPGTLISSRLGYFLRNGRHSTTSEDWRAFLDFAEAQWGKAR